MSKILIGGGLVGLTVSMFAAGYTLRASQEGTERVPAACARTEDSDLLDCETGQPLRYEHGRWVR